MKTPDGFVPVIKKCMIVAVFAVACMVAGEILIRKAPNPYSIKHHYMMNHGKDVETLLLGSSHIFYGVNPAGFNSKTYNLANLLQGPRLNYELLNYYSAILTNNSLQRIIINICGVTLVEPNLQLIRNQGYLSAYQMYMRLPGYESLSLNFEIFTPSLYRQRIRTILKMHANVLSDADSLGFGTQYLLVGDSVDVSVSGTQMGSYTSTFSTEQINKNLIYIDSIALWCRARNIELILLETPKYKTYNEAISSGYILAKDSAISQFRLRFPEVKYLDFSTDPRFGIGDYYDGNHLCHRGAEKFTKILSDTLHI